MRQVFVIYDDVGVTGEPVAVVSTKAKALEFIYDNAIKADERGVGMPNNLKFKELSLGGHRKKGAGEAA